MSLDLRYPIVMERRLFCKGRCQRHTNQHSVIYPDTEYNTCAVCKEKNTVHYNRTLAVVYEYEDVDREQLNNIANELNQIVGDMTTHSFGRIGKKDRTFINRIRDRVLAVRLKVDKLRDHDV